MERVSTFWEHSVVEPGWKEQLGAFGSAALLTLGASHYLSGVPTCAAVCGTALAALNARDRDEEESSPLTGAAIGMISGAALASFVGIAKILNDEVTWTVQGVINGIALPIATLGLSVDVLWNGWEGNSSQKSAENHWSTTCRDAALFAIPAGFNLLLAHMNVHPTLTSAILPSLVGLFCWVKVHNDEEFQHKPVMLGVLLSSLLLSGLLMVQRSTLKTWNWADRGAMFFLGSATAANAAGTIYFISEEKQAPEKYSIR